MTKLQGVFTENLKNARKKANLTQEALAEKVGLTAKHIGVIERGIKFPTIQMLEAIADALEIPAYVLFLPRIDEPGRSTIEIINMYNTYLEENLSLGLKSAKEKFLAIIANKEENN